MEKQNNLTLGSLFDGSAGFPLGGLLSGVTPLWASEIEPFPIRVTTKRLPQMKHYGDISKMNGGEMRCRLIDGRYPNYNSVIPNNPNEVTFYKMSKRKGYGANHALLW